MPSAEALEQIAKAARRAEEVADLARQAETTRQSDRFANRVVADIDAQAKQMMAEYEAFTADPKNSFANELTPPAREPAPVFDREKELFDPSTEVGIEGGGALVQTNSPEEFTRRMREQLVDPLYSVRNTLGENSEYMLSSLQASQAKHQGDVDRILGTLRRDTRWGSSYGSWVGDSAYKDNLMFHVEKYTDPTRAGSGDFIQFENAREMGVHAGTADAANRIIHAGGVDIAIDDAADFADSIDELAGMAGIPRKTLNKHVTRELEDHFLRKFKGEQTLGDMTSDEWKMLIDRVSNNLGVEESQELDRLFAFLKEAPTPNSTPMLFRGKNGLLLPDEGNFRPDTVLEHLEAIFPEDQRLLDAMSGGRKELTKKLQDYIEGKGYDHIVYHNSVEDKGNLSIINWNPDLQVSPWDLNNGGDRGAAAVAAQSFLAIMGIAGAQEGG